MFDALPAPSVYHMDMAIATLDDGGVGVLQDGRVFERYPVVPMDVRAPFSLVGSMGQSLQIMA